MIWPVDHIQLSRLWRRSACGRRTDPRWATLQQNALCVMSESPGELAALKTELRVRAHALREKQPGKDEASRTICHRFAGLSAYEASHTVMCYVHVRDEVRTQRFLEALLGSNKRVVIPYCAGDDLGLFLLEDMNELATGHFEILEPDQRLRSLEHKRVGPKEIDLVMVPGVAFDVSGGRLGHGRGYYDRLLTDVRPDTPLVALAFECQLFPSIPMGPHDVYMDLVVTEKETYRGRGRSVVGC